MKTLNFIRTDKNDNFEMKTCVSLVIREAISTATLLARSLDTAFSIGFLRLCRRRAARKIGRPGAEPLF